MSVGIIRRKTGSKHVVNLLSQLGVSVSYYNVELYETSTIMNPPRLVINNAFVLFVFDNTDHNVRTLDGRKTFHCLGGIVIHTPQDEVKYLGGVKRLKEMLSADSNQALCPCSRGGFKENRVCFDRCSENRRMEAIRPNLLNLLMVQMCGFTEYTDMKRLYGRMFEIRIFRAVGYYLPTIH